MSTTEKDVMEQISRDELIAAAAHLKSEAARYVGAKRSGLEALRMAAFERLDQAAERYLAAVEARSKELGLCD